MKPGDRIRDYEFVSLIGVGGMGEVWKALHIHLGTHCAIKIMAEHLTGDPGFSDRFLGEARTMAHLEHPLIVGIRDFFVEGGRRYLVMPYIHGRALDEILEGQRGPLPLKTALQIAGDALGALNYAHGKGVIHRDVKPSNILVDDEGRAHLTDFGIAVMVGEKRFTRTGTAIGTPHYMSPEQFSKPKSIDHRTDVYSFGCVLYEMLAGRPVFEDDEGAEFAIQQAHVNKAPEPLSRWNPTIPPAIESAVMRSLSKLPEERFTSCGEFARALGGEVAPPPPPRPQPEEGVRKRTVREPAPDPSRREKIRKETVREAPPKPHPEEFRRQATVPEPKPPPRPIVDPPLKPDQGMKYVKVFLTILIPVLVVVVIVAVSGRSKGPEVEPSPPSWTPPVREEPAREPTRSRPEPADEPVPATASSTAWRSDKDGLTYNRVPWRGGEFWLCSTEVTVGAFRKFIRETNHATGQGGIVYNNGGWRGSKAGNWLDPESPSGDSCPVVFVNLDDARDYARWIGGRLPTEEEWEYACNGGGEGWGGDVDACCWYAGNSGFRNHPVGGKRSNPLGLFDMLGNAWEWTEDGAVRGGAWDAESRQLHPGYRMTITPERRTQALSFRPIGPGPR